MLIYFSIIIFIFGLIIGSFLNVVILRLHEGKSFAKGRSMCPQCGHVLGLLDLVPLFSFIFLRGRCRFCQAKISWQYPGVELLTGVLFILALIVETNGLKFPISNFQFPMDSNFMLIIFRDWVVISALIIIFVYDLRWMIIPDSVVLPAIAIVMILNYLIGVPIVSMAIGLAIGVGFFGLQFVVSKGAWIGGGDLRLGALMGVLLGWKLILVALFLAYIVGAIISLFLLAQKKVTAKSAVPFGVFLVPATIVALFWGQTILTWYLRMM